MSFISEFKERGFFHQATDIESIDKLSKTEKFAAYIGFDCTANSLHVGSLTMIMCLRLMQKHGIKPIVIIGGGTTKIGDPSGKDEARKILTDEDINFNAQGIKNDISKFIHFGDQENDAIIVNNDDWLKDIKYADFLRDYGRHFSINRMLTFDSVKLRLEREQNLSFLEFNYMLLQAYDFAYLNKNYNCRLQVGGSDQWGNIVNGVELNRRLGQKEIFGLTTPLLTTANGAKMGKTASGAVWLSKSLLPAYDYYQYWRNVDDLDVTRFLLMFTDLEITQIKDLENSNINESKKILAFEATKLCHGEEAANEAALMAKKIFEEGDKTGIPVTIDLEGVKELAAYQLIAKTREVESGGEAKRLIRGKGVKINDILVEDENQKIEISSNSLRISIGKKKHLIVSFK